MISIVPANEASFEDLQTIFGARGPGARCQCQRYKLRPGEAFRSFPAEERAFRLREQTDCGNPGSDTTSGLVAYLDGEPAGWCAVEPRTAYEGLLRVFRVPWDGRDEDKADGTVWAVTCLFTRAGYRKRGISRALAAAAVDHARDRGARALEAYPITTKNVIDEELHVGTPATFAAAGLVEVNRPSKRRTVMRVDFLYSDEVVAAGEEPVQDHEVDGEDRDRVQRIDEDDEDRDDRADPGEADAKRAAPLVAPDDEHAGRELCQPDEQPEPAPGVEAHAVEHLRRLRSQGVVIGHRGEAAQRVVGADHERGDAREGHPA
jgi:GNAT superfamily N-acetyltransferase